MRSSNFNNRWKCRLYKYNFIFLSSYNKSSFWTDISGSSNVGCPPRLNCTIPSTTDAYSEYRNLIKVACLKKRLDYIDTSDTYGGAEICEDPDDVRLSPTETLNNLLDDIPLEYNIFGQR
uniref:Aldo_ket_red domain-containing protein n=1 Tax=Rhabditophanes sp. KR3021 TaxID=114890 RepID=A0AC35U2I0_9BILA